MIEKWSTRRCHVALFQCWIRPDETFMDEDDPRNGFMDMVSKEPIRAATEECEHLMGGVLALDSDGFAQPMACSRVSETPAVASQNQGVLFLNEDGFLEAAIAYSTPRVVTGTWVGNDSTRPI